MDVGEVLAQFGRVPLHPLVEGDAQALGEQLDALGGDVDEIGAVPAAIWVRIFAKKSDQSVACTALIRSLMSGWTFLKPSVSVRIASGP